MAGNIRRKQTAVVVLANREIREVPLDWKHPVDKSGQPVPLFSFDGSKDDASVAELAIDDVTTQDVEERFMPDFSHVPKDKMGVAVYETTTEGTPITPVFPNTPAGLRRLLKYCARRCSTFADFRADVEEWARMLGLQSVLKPVHAP